MPGNDICGGTARGSALGALPWGLVLLVVGLGLSSLPRESRSQQAGASRSGRGAASAPLLCEEPHRPRGGAGESGPLDLGAIRGAYAALATGLARKLDAAAAAPASRVTTPERSWDAGLPACRGTASRRERFPGDLGARLRGKTLFFGRLGRSEDFELPAEVRRDPGALVFVLGARSPKDLRGLEERLGRSVTPATGELARTLGVRCVNTLVSLSERGEEATFHESP